MKFMLDSDDLVQMARAEESEPAIDYLFDVKCHHGRVFQPRMWWSQNQEHWLSELQQVVFQFPDREHAKRFTTDERARMSFFYELCEPMTFEEAEDTEAFGAMYCFGGDTKVLKLPPEVRIFCTGRNAINVTRLVMKLQGTRDDVPMHEVNHLLSLAMELVRYTGMCCLPLLDPDDDRPSNS